VTPSVKAVDNRVTRLLGVDIPILQAPMGHIAKPALVAAVAEAGAVGLVPGSLGHDETKADIRRIRELTDRRFGLNIPIAFVRDPAIVQLIVDEGIEFVTTSAGSPARYTPVLKEAGLTVFHVVPSLTAALKAVDAGVDGLIVEGSEGAGFKNPRDVSTMVLLLLICSRVSVPVIAAGGIADGLSMAAAFALGAEGVLMGTRMMASAESLVHDNLKQAVVNAAETDTMIINRVGGRPVRVFRTETTAAFEFGGEGNPMDLLADIVSLYRGGELDVSLPQFGQVAGRIDSVLPVGEIIARTVGEFQSVIGRLAGQYLGAAEPDELTWDDPALAGRG
jgi:enoyl-[acyl-carrier protein] reductase II